MTLETGSRAYSEVLPPGKRALLSDLSRIAGLPAASDANFTWPVVIVGAGPSGTAAAIVLRRRNVPVLLLDRHGAPREKVCGDGLIADSHDALRALGVLEQVMAVGFSTRAGHIVSPSGFETIVTADFTTLERHFLDGILLREAIRQGATFRVANVRSVDRRHDGFALRLDGANGPVQARCLVIASGAGAPCWPGPESPPSAVAARCYIRSAVPKAEMFMSFRKAVPNGYGWVFPLGSDVYNVGVIQFRSANGRPRRLNELFRTFVEGEPVVSALWKAASPLTRLKGAPLRCGLDAVAAAPAEATMAIGERCATTFPFTGEGIGKALQSGILAAEEMIAALDDGRPHAAGSAYAERLVRELGPSYRGYALAQKWLSRPWMHDVVVRRVDKSAFMRAVATGVITGSARADQLFSVRNVVRSFWK
jgi:flavin-dependent dehydrogenase